MKVFIVALLCSVGLAQAAGTYAQNARISLEANNQTVREVLHEIEAQSEFDFFFNNKHVDLDRRVSVAADRDNIFEVLDEVFEGTNVKYTVLDKKIILSTELCEASAQQQTKAVSGTVLDTNGEPLIGATVALKSDNSKGTITDINGHFRLEGLPSNAVLQVAYIGYRTVEVPVAGQKELNVVLKEDTKTLDEVVVIGYGSQRKSDLTGGLVAVGKEKLEMVQSSNLLDRLAGQIPGLSVTTGDAAPGSDQTLLIRGENSLSASNSPLIVLDGIPYSGSLGDIDPNIIENLSVLKDASAAAIYGSRGSNGVILIQTKKGKVGAPQVTYKGQIRMSQPQQTIDVMNGEEYIKYRQDIYRLKDGWSGDQLNPENWLSASELINYNQGITTDWQDLIFRNALTHEHQVGISGGTESTTYMAAVSYLGQEGVVENSKLTRYNINLNVTQVLNKWLTIGVQTQFVQRENGGITPNIEHAVKQSPYGLFKDENGNYHEEPMDQSLIVNPFTDVPADQDRTRRNVFINTFADIKLPVKGLSARTTFGYNYRNDFTGTYYPRTTKTGRPTQGKASISNTNYWDYTWENLVKYSNDFGKHHFDATGLFSVQQTQSKSSSLSAEKFVNDDSSYHNIAAGEQNKTVGSSLSETAMLSYMLRLNYSYAGKYMLTLTGRSDGYSAFGANNKYAFFPSVAVAWNVASEDFMEGAQGWLDQLKLRVSYGSNGNQAINPYQTLDRLHTTQYIYGDGAQGVNGAYLPNDGVGNPNLRWETTNTFNVGIDYSFFKGRINGNIEMYVANTKDLLMSRTVPIMNGFSKIMDNVGQTRNKGVEVTLNTVNIRNKDWEWKTSINFSLNRDKIIELRGDGKDDITNRWFIGKPLRVFYDYEVDGIWQEGDQYTYITSEGVEEEIQKGAKPGWAKIKDIDGNGKIDSNDKTIIGSKNPSFLMSMGNTVTYKNFYLSLLLNGTFKVTRTLNEANIGGWGYSLYNYIADASYWTPETPNAKYPSPAYTTFDGHSFYKDFTYINIKNITLGYNFDSQVCKKMGISGLGLNLSVENLYTFCDQRNIMNYDASYAWAYPTARSFSLGVNLTF